MTPIPDLSALTKAEATDLELIARAAIVKFMVDAEEAKGRLKASGGSGRWADKARIDFARADELETAARAFHAAAHRRSLQAGQEECIAIRMIAALAQRAMAVPKALAA